MKNKEKYFDELIQIIISGFPLAVDERTNEPRKCDSNISCLDCLFGEGSCINGRKEWLEQEYQESPILDEKEKEYLNAVIKPWRDKVESIVKKLCFEFGYIVIQYRDDMGYTSTVILPNFPKGTMYKGMELNKDYSIEDLGL